jgi:hypothetical protein
MSRRRFLSATSGALLAAPFLAGAAGEQAPAVGEGYVDLAEFLPKTKARIVGAVVRPKPEQRTGWPGREYDFEGRRQTFEKGFLEAAERVGVGLELTPDVLDDDAAVNAFASRMLTENPDAILLHIQDLLACRSAEIIAVKTGLPTIIFEPIGTSVSGVLLALSRRAGVHVISSSETAPVEQAFRMVRAKHHFENSRVLVLTDTHKHEEVFMKPLGVTVRYMPLSVLCELYLSTPATGEAEEVVRIMRQQAAEVSGPTDQELLDAARWFIATKRLLRAESANALTSDCMEILSWKQVLARPCMASTMLLDNKVVFGCDKDLHGTLSLMLGVSLLDRPGYIGNPIMETYRNTLILSHCTCATRLNGYDSPPEPVVLRHHAEMGAFVATQVLWKKDQQVTMAQFDSPNELILDTGTVVGNIDTRVDGGCRTSVEVVVDRLEDVREKLGLHQVMFYGNHRHILEAFCQLYEIKVTNSPERATRSPIPQPRKG